MDDLSDTPPLPSTDWDVIISGTGIKQSLLAVALGRAGKTVLQLDKNKYYGGSSAAFYSLSEVDAWAVKVNSGDEAGVTDAVTSGGAGAGGGERGYALSLAPHLIYWFSDVLGMLRRADMTDGFSWQAVGSWWVWLTEEDVSAPAAGGARLGIAEVGIKVAKGVAAAGRKGKGWNKGRKKETVVEDGESGELAASRREGEGEGEQREGEATLRQRGDFREVPCTFEDVAWSGDLTDKDRGQLGEFLRFVMKYNDPTDQKYNRIFQENRKTTLEVFLSTTFLVPPFIITSISSLTLLPSSPGTISVEESLPRLAAHFSSLGKIPDVRSSAALTIAFGGSAELCQVLSRAAAIAGGINVLGRGINRLLPNPGDGGRMLQAQLASGETVYTDWAIGENSDLARQAQETGIGGQNSLTRGIYVVRGDMSWLFERKYKDENITPAAAVVVVPTANGVPIYFVARSAVTGECPKGQCILHAVTSSSYKAVVLAVEKLLNASSPPPEILYSLQYTVTTQTPAEAGEEGVESGVIVLDSLSHDIALQDGILEEVLAVYERVVGSRDGFMELSEEIRRVKEEMEE